jgi:hypothetical protein
MAYCTAAQVKNAHKPIPDTVAETTIIEGFIADVDSEIDFRLAIVGFSVPFSPVPPIITIISKYKSISRELMRLYGSQVQEGFAEWAKKFDKVAEDNMKRLEQGAALLAADGSVAVAAPIFIQSTTEDFELIFNLNDELEWDLREDDTDIRYGEDT